VAASDFIDYYELMQISPNAEAETVHRVFRMLAARYHPDNPQTGDMERFVLLNQAFEILTNPSLRADYDLLYQTHRLEPIRVFDLKEFALGIDGEANRRMGLLCLLYNRRRTNPEHAGMSLLEFETLMSVPREHLMFTLWYLREKDFVRQSENSDLVITAQGADWVETHLPKNRILYKLLKAAETGSVRGVNPTEAAASPEQQER
jgi:curved DNA-binding protein CbpA